MATNWAEEKCIRTGGSSKSRIHKGHVQTRGVAFSVCFKRVNKVVIVASLTALRRGEGLKDGAIDGDYRPTMKAGRPKIFLMFFNSPNIQLTLTLIN